MINITTKIKPRYVEPRNGEVRLDAPGLVEHQSVDSPAHLLVHPVASQRHYDGPGGPGGLVLPTSWSTRLLVIIIAIGSL